jgi:hypothetical protein
MRVKLYLDGKKSQPKQSGMMDTFSAPGDDASKRDSGEACLAEATFSFAEIKVQHNTVLNFVLPFKQGIDLRTTGHLQTKYNVDKLHALFQIKITDNTFGEVMVNLDKFTKVPKSQYIEYL